ncbi:transposase family protein [Photobacterium sagamiensis]|uniref:transposase family protein n=1 Tax=Photobacterium sagamiensis TaxID=2910241 RepID=UPI003D102199
MLSDPRQNVKLSHNLFDIPFLTLVAIICGEQRWEEIEIIGLESLDWLQDIVRSKIIQNRR